MWTKSQKISAAVLGLAASAFAVDRFVLERPADDTVELSDVAAAQPAVKRTAGPAAGKPLASPAVPATQAVTLASRLAALGEARRFTYETCGDAFRPCDDWLAQAVKEAPRSNTPDTQDTTQTVKKVDPADEFRSRHTLNAVMTRQGGGMAIVDGKLYAIGQVVDGFKLTKVDDVEVTFTRNDGVRATLRLLKQDTGTMSGNTASATAR